MKLMRLLLALSVGVLLAACGEEAQVAGGPPPQEPGPEAVGHFCGMIVAEHPGPKGQIFLEGQEEPIWFSSVRDTIAYTLLPEGSKRIAAIYVNDMAQVTTWEHPEEGAWVAAREAVYVVGSSMRGGMGATETVPFSDRTVAERFRERHGGTIVAFDEVPEDYVLGPGTGPQLSTQPVPHGMAGGTGHEGQEAHGQH